MDDDLTGSPELFASNLLIVRAIEHGMDQVTIQLEDGAVAVQNHHPEQDYDKEILTENTEIWADIRERFQDMTEFEERNDRGLLSSNIPATGRTEKITVAYPNEQTIEISFHY